MIASVPRSGPHMGHQISKQFFAIMHHKCYSYNQEKIVNNELPGFPLIQEFIDQKEIVQIEDHHKSQHIGD